MSALTAQPATALVRLDGGEPWTSSLIIATEFARQHKNVLTSLDSLIADATLQRGLEIKPTFFDVVGPNGAVRQERAFQLNERAALIAMPFIGGRKSREAQKRLVDAFLAARAELAHRNDLLRRQTRHDGKRGRLVLTDAVHELVSYATAQGSRHAGKYYQAITRMEYQALFFIDAAVGDGFRDRLTALQNMNLGTAEAIAQRAIREGMAAGLHYKAIYQLAKQRVEQVAGLLGKQDPGADALQITRAA